jgi:hypothetical protein
MRLSPCLVSPELSCRRRSKTCRANVLIAQCFAFTAAWASGSTRKMALGECRQPMTPDWTTVGQVRGRASAIAILDDSGAIASTPVRLR